MRFEDRYEQTYISEILKRKEKRTSIKIRGLEKKKKKKKKKFAPSVSFDLLVFYTIPFKVLRGSRFWVYYKFSVLESIVHFFLLYCSKSNLVESGHPILICLG